MTRSPCSSFKTQPTFTSSSMTFDVLRSCVEIFASMTSNDLEFSVKGFERTSCAHPRTRVVFQDQPLPGSIVQDDVEGMSFHQHREHKVQRLVACHLLRVDHGNME